jgi:biopolymer transport protein ExbB/TolQ
MENMELVILVSVLCTLGVVGIVTAIVVAFNKLNKKVEDRSNDTNHEIERVYDYIKEEVNGLGRNTEELHREMNEQFRRSDNERDESINEVYRTIDSRCDKLDSKIQGKLCKCLPNVKQVLTD